MVDDEAPADNLLDIADNIDWWTRIVGRPKRVMSPLRYYGGKGNLARHIIPLLPDGSIYVEPYCGAASVFWHLPEGHYGVEVLNDLDGRVINVFRVLQDPQKFKQFAHRVYWTPYSHAEFVRALGLLDSVDDVDAAWAFYVVTNQVMGGINSHATPGRWGRSFSSGCGMAGTANSWRKRMTRLRAWHERLTRVQIDCRDALEVIGYWDSPRTVFYIDPPYVPDTRKSRSVYRCEADADHHRQLVELLMEIRGSAVVSGYDHPVYKPLEEAGWERYEIKTACAAAARTRSSNIRGRGAALEKVPRTEIIWRRNVQRSGRLIQPPLPNAKME
jgi:DNA adenine methylase